MYWLQVGENLQLDGNKGEIVYWYTKTGNIAIFRSMDFAMNKSYNCGDCVGNQKQTFRIPS